MAGPVLPPAVDFNPTMAPSTQSVAATTRTREKLAIAFSFLVRSSFRSGERKLEPEGRALAAGAFEVDAAVVSFDQRPRDCKAEPAALDPVGGCVAAHEAAEDLVPHVLGGADPLVADADVDPRAVAPSRDTDDPSARRILDRVRQQ